MGITLAANASHLSHRPLPRPPRDPTGPLILHLPPPPAEPVEHSAAVAAPAPMSGPRWVSAPPPRYHLAAAQDISQLAVTSPPPRADLPAHPSAPAGASTLRCPRCKETFSWTRVRPTRVVCPHCGAQGNLN